MLLDKDFRFFTGPAEQSIEFGAGYSYRQQDVAFVIMIVLANHAQLEQLGPQPGMPLGQAQHPDEKIFAEQFGHGLTDQLQTTAFARRDPDPDRASGFIVALDMRLAPVEQIELVVDLQHRQLVGTDFVQHRLDLLDLQLAIVLVGMRAPPNLGFGYARRFREVYPELAEKNDVPLVPFLLEGVGGVESLNQADGVHPTAAGHERMAETVWRVLEPVLRNH